MSVCLLFLFVCSHLLFPTQINFNIFDIVSIPFYLCSKAWIQLYICIFLVPSFRCGFKVSDFVGAQACSRFSTYPRQLPTRGSSISTFSNKINKITITTRYCKPTCRNRYTFIFDRCSTPPGCACLLRPCYVIDPSRECPRTRRPTKSAVLGAHWRKMSFSETCSSQRIPSSYQVPCRQVLTLLPTPLFQSLVQTFPTLQSDDPNSCLLHPRVLLP